MFGFDAESVAALRLMMAGARPNDQEGVWPENAAVVDAFLMVSSQWRTASIGGGFVPARMVFVGHDYTAVQAGLTGAGIGATAELWQGLRIMEAAARDALNGIRG